MWNLLLHWNLLFQVSFITASLHNTSIRQSFPIFSSNVHITTAENGTIMITFSIHSVVSFCSPFTVSQMPHPSITSDKEFIHRFRFNRVRNRISEDTKNKKNMAKNKEQCYIFIMSIRLLKFSIILTIAFEIFFST